MNSSLELPQNEIANGICPINTEKARKRKRSLSKQCRLSFRLPSLKPQTEIEDTASLPTAGFSTKLRTTMTSRVGILFRQCSTDNTSFAIYYIHITDQWPP